MIDNLFKVRINHFILSFAGEFSYKDDKDELQLTSHASYDVLARPIEQLYDICLGTA